MRKLKSSDESSSALPAAAPLLPGEGNGVCRNRPGQDSGRVLAPEWKEAAPPDQERVQRRDSSPEEESI